MKRKRVEHCTVCIQQTHLHLWHGIAASHISFPWQCTDFSSFHFFFHRQIPNKFTLFTNRAKTHSHDYLFKTFGCFAHGFLYNRIYNNIQLNRVWFFSRITWIGWQIDITFSTVSAWCMCFCIQQLKDLLYILVRTLVYCIFYLLKMHHSIGPLACVYVRLSIGFCAMIILTLLNTSNTSIKIVYRTNSKCNRNETKAYCALQFLCLFLFLVFL